MKALVKIILLFTLIFGLSVYITKITIDQTFKRVECTQEHNFMTTIEKAPKTIKV